MSAKELSNTTHQNVPAAPLKDSVATNEGSDSDLDDVDDADDLESVAAGEAGATDNANGDIAVADFEATDSEATTDSEASAQVFAAWRLNTGFDGVDATAQFNEVMSRRPTRAASINGTTTTTVGIQCSKNSANTPSKAWRQIFTESLMNKIISYTNDYGQAKCKEWVPINKSDLMDFISVLSFQEYKSERMPHQTGFRTHQYAIIQS